MNYVLRILKEHKQMLEDKNKKTETLYRVHKNQADELQQTMTRRELNILEINKKIKAIEKDTYI